MNATSKPQQQQQQLLQQHLNKGDERDLFRSQFKKTKLCSFFKQGRCAYGGSCAFAHDAAETAPDLTKTSLCKNWREGTCTLSSASCNFAHGKHELRVTPLFSRNRRVNHKDEACSEEHAVASKSVATSIRRGSQNTLKASAAPDPRADAWDAAGTAINRSPCSVPLPVYKERSLSPSPLFEASPLDSIKPMKVISSFFTGNVGGISPLSAPMRLQVVRSSDHWEGDTATGETSSDDDGSPSLDVSADSTPQHFQGITLDEWAMSGSGYSAFSGMPPIMW